MNVVIWARVSSREQREGYSLDAQLRADRERAAREGWNVVREFSVAESAKRGADRTEFNAMLKWIKSSAKREKIEAILAHKLDRVCRNMRDAVRLQDLEDNHSVQLRFVENEFGAGPAGALSFNVMAAVAQYYSDNLRTEVLKGIDERARQGWPHGLAAFGYMNVPENRCEPVQPHPEKSKAVVRMFELYSSGRFTLEGLAKQLHEDGHTYRPSQPKFHRTALSYVLNNRIYVGEIKRGDSYFPGKHQPLIDRSTFKNCQDILSGKNKKTASNRPDHLLAGGLFGCHFCGSLITGERIRRKLRTGGVRVHQYYRCANNKRDSDHPQVRWKEADLEEAVGNDLAKMRLPSDEIADWFRTSLRAAFSNEAEVQRERSRVFAKRKSEIATKQDRLLKDYLAGTVDEATFKAKRDELVTELAEAEEGLRSAEAGRSTDVDSALAVFDFSQNAAEKWLGSKMASKREILESVSLNRTLSDVSLVIAKRKPFDILAERPLIQLSRDDRRLTFLNDRVGAPLLTRLLSLRHEFTAEKFLQCGN